MTLLIYLLILSVALNILLGAYIALLKASLSQERKMHNGALFDKGRLRKLFRETNKN
jgi:hypothetical protein